MTILERFRPVPASLALATCRTKKTPVHACVAVSKPSAVTLERHPCAPASLKAGGPRWPPRRCARACTAGRRCRRRSASSACGLRQRRRTAAERRRRAWVSAQRRVPRPGGPTARGLHQFGAKPASSTCGRHRAPAPVRAPRGAAARLEDPNSHSRICRARTDAQTRYTVGRRTIGRRSIAS